MDPRRQCEQERFGNAVSARIRMPGRAVTEDSAERVRAMATWLQVDPTHVASSLLCGKASRLYLLSKQTSTSPALSSLLAPATPTPALSSGPFLHWLFTSDRTRTGLGETAPLTALRARTAERLRAWSSLQPPPQPYELGLAAVPSLQMRKLRPRAVMSSSHNVSEPGMKHRSADSRSTAALQLPANLRCAPSRPLQPAPSRERRRATSQGILFPCHGAKLCPWRADLGHDTGWMRKQEKGRGSAAQASKAHRGCWEGELKLAKVTFTWTSTCYTCTCPGGFLYLCCQRRGPSWGGQVRDRRT